MKPVMSADHDTSKMLALRADILASPVSVGLERARVYTHIWQENEGVAWIVKKGMALREHLRTTPLFIRPNDLLAGSISDTPGAMPLFPELGFGENGIYVGENPERRGYLEGQVPQDILDYWEDRNLWGQHRAYKRAVEGGNPKRTDVTGYKYISCQGHLSPAYSEVLAVGLDALVDNVRQRRVDENDMASLEFLAAAEHTLLGTSEWIERYAALLTDDAATCSDTERADELREMSTICARIAHEAPTTFHEAMQLVWFCHQIIHIEGHGYSCTPDRLDQILYPFYVEDKQAGRLDDDRALSLCENFILKQRDNTFWGVEHNLTQGLVVGGSTPDGADQTNELSWHFITACGAMSVPEPLVWVRWHPNIDRDFFDHCLKNLAGTTCFPLMMSDTAVPEMFMALGLSREDAFNYVAVGCNELGVPGQTYFNPGANSGHQKAIELAMTGGRGLNGKMKPPDFATEPSSLDTFDRFAEEVGRYMRRTIENSYNGGLKMLAAQMRWGQTPFTSCFFDGCVERGRDMIEGTKYNIMTCGGSAFPTMVDCMLSIRDVVYEKGDASLEEVTAACAANFEGYESLRRKLLDAPKHGNDDARTDEVVRLCERLRDEPMKEICRDPRDGSQFGNGHVTRSGAVRGGLTTPATPDGRLAGTPLASSVAASCGAEQHGPTAVLNSILKMDPVKSWQCGYNANIRFHHSMLVDDANRELVHAMLASFFSRGGQEMQVNCVDSDTLRAAQEHPDDYRDLVVRVAGFSEFFVNLRPEIQADVIARTEHHAS